MFKKSFLLCLAIGTVMFTTCTKAAGDRKTQVQSQVIYEQCTDENDEGDRSASMETGETVQMDKRQYVEELYAELERMAEDGEEADAWGGELLFDFYLLFVNELYSVQDEEPEWVFMYEQLYHWQFESIHEGISTFYTNFYDSDADNGIQRMSDCLYRHGYMEIARWYDYGVFDYSLYPDFDYPAEYGMRMAEIDEWIGKNTETIWQVYMELLQGHKEEVLEAAASWVPDSGAEEEKEEAIETGNIPEPAFQSVINLVTDKDTKRYRDMSYLVASEIDEDTISQMVETERLRRIQTTEAFSREALKLLDEKLFANRGDIVLRIYGLQNGDLRHFEDMVHVQRLGLDSMEDIANAEVLSRFEHLEELEFHLSGRRDYSFVNGLSPEIKTLSLYVDFSRDGVVFGEDLDGESSLYEMEWLLRFPGLQSLYIGNSSRHIEFLIRKDSVRELILYEMPCPSPEVLRMLNVQSVIVHQENAQESETEELLDRLGQMETLQEVELVRLAGIDNLDFLENMTALRRLTLRSLPDLDSLPHFPEGQKLSELAVYDCEKLTDLSEISEAANQWRVRQYSSMENHE